MTESEIEFFDRLAPRWDANEMRSTPQRINKILDMLDIRKGMKVLDLGTGTGVLLPYLSERVGEEGTVVGIDLSEGMLSLAKKKYGGLPNVQFLKIDFEEDQIPGRYHLVMLYCVYPHLHHPSDTFDWLFKMNVEPGGSIVVAFPSDENFINSIHHERKAEHDHLPPAPVLAEMFRSWGYAAEVLAATPDEYVVALREK